MKTKYYVLALMLALMATMNSTTACAQLADPISAGDRVLFVEIARLNTDNFQKIYTALSDADQGVSIKQSCVPAGIIMLNIPAENTSNLDLNFTQFKDLVFTQTGISDVKLLAEYSEENFLDRCKQFRGSGRP